MQFQKIRDLREDSDITQNTISKILKVSRSTYARYENGILKIPPEVLIVLSNIYNTSIDYLLGITNNKTPHNRVNHIYKLDSPPSKTRFIYPRIKELRKENNYKQSNISENSFFAQTTYSDYETGKLKIPPKLLIFLADFYDTSVDYILGITDIKEPYRKNT